MTTIIQFTNDNVSKEKKHRFLMEVAKKYKGVGIMEAIHTSDLTAILKSLN